MYWPIGAPRVYTAKTPPFTTPIDYNSDDSPDLVRTSVSDSSEAVETEPSDSLKESTEDEDDGRKIGEKEVEDEESLPEIPRNTHNGETLSSESGDAAEAESMSHIIALTVARSGLLFATVTRSDLTIWQTKVRNFWEIACG
jgi:hypothetical protein